MSSDKTQPVLFWDTIRITAERVRSTIQYYSDNQTHIQGLGGNNETIKVNWIDNSSYLCWHCRIMQCFYYLSCLIDEQWCKDSRFCGARTTFKLLCSTNCLLFFLLLMGKTELTLKWCGPFLQNTPSIMGWSGGRGVTECTDQEVSKACNNQ